LTGGTTKITQKQICAGSFLHGTAPGDSGGPLQIMGPDGRYYQIGITSFGADLLEGVIDQEKYPGIYTRVALYYNWIHSMMESNGTNLIIAPNFYIYIFIFCILLIMNKL
uniref:Peptidase S1 domain-containing protein n=1 Tax=Dracunculus medinensis TaxID=318479 RepID=A0A0N4U859_DRAME